MSRRRRKNASAAPVAAVPIPTVAIAGRVERTTVAGNLVQFQRRLIVMMQDGWVPTLLAGGYGQHVSQFVCILERPAKAEK